MKALFTNYAPICLHFLIPNTVESAYYDEYITVFRIQRFPATHLVSFKSHVQYVFVIWIKRSSDITI